MTSKLNRSLFQELQNPRHLWIRYLVALSLLLGLVGATHYFQISKLDASARYAELINISGQQRMLSQRILMLSGLVVREQKSSDLAALKDTIQTFSQNYDWLVSEGMEEEVVARFYAPRAAEAVTERIGDFVRQAEALHAAQEFEAYDAAWASYDQLMASGKNALLGDLDDVVTFYEKIAKDSVNSLTRLQSLALISAILLLFLEAVFIFYPAQKSVTRSLDEAKRAADALEESNRQLAAAAYLDDLTGIANRRGFFRHLDHVIKTDLLKDRSAVLCVVDLDGFKLVNDTRGHRAGDLVLMASARALSNAIDPDDFLARMGGDEFAVLHLAEKNSEITAHAFAERLVSAIRGLDEDAGDEQKLAASVGFRHIDAATTDYSRLIEDADLALYQAKRSGKGQAVIYRRASRSDDAMSGRERSSIIAFDARRKTPE